VGNRLEGQDWTSASDDCLIDQQDGQAGRESGCGKCRDSQQYMGAGLGVGIQVRLQ
jgi:hypothetical protein